MKLKGSIREDHFDLDYQEPLSFNDLEYVRKHMKKEIAETKTKLEQLDKELEEFRLQLGEEIKASNQILIERWKIDIKEFRKLKRKEKLREYVKQKKLKRLRDLGVTR